MTDFLFAETSEGKSIVQHVTQASSSEQQSHHIENNKQLSAILLSYGTDFHLIYTSSRTSPSSFCYPAQLMILRHNLQITTVQRRPRQQKGGG